MNSHPPTFLGSEIFSKATVKNMDLPFKISGMHPKRGNYGPFRETDGFEMTVSHPNSMENAY